MILELSSPKRKLYRLNPGISPLIEKDPAPDSLTLATSIIPFSDGACRYKN